jgi:hypothetical protein
VNDYLRDLPKILVGCKKDLRNDNAKLDSLHRQRLIPISPYAVSLSLSNMHHILIPDAG